MLARYAAPFARAVPPYTARDAFHCTASRLHFHLDLFAFSAVAAVAGWCCGVRNLSCDGVRGWVDAGSVLGGQVAEHTEDHLLPLLFSALLLLLAPPRSALCPADRRLAFPGPAPHSRTRSPHTVEQVTAQISSAINHPSRLTPLIVSSPICRRRAHPTAIQFTLAVRSAPSKSPPTLHDRPINAAQAT